MRGGTCACADCKLALMRRPLIRRFAAPSPRKRGEGHSAWSWRESLAPRSGERVAKGRVRGRDAAPPRDARHLLPASGEKDTRFSSAQRVSAALITLLLATAAHAQVQEKITVE